MSRVCIIGAGPAGATAARLLADAGVACVPIDDNEAAGGQIWRQGPDLQDPRGDRLRRSVQGLAVERLEHHAAAQVVDIAPGSVQWLSADGRLHRTEADFLLIAAGAVERFLPVQGWDRPGVFGLGGLQILLKAGGVLPSGPVLLAGSGPLLYLVGAQLVAARVPVSAVVDEAGWPTEPGLLALPGPLARGIGFELALRRARVPILRRTRLARIEADHALTSAGRHIQASVVAMGQGIIPNIELFSRLGCALDHDPEVGGWHPRRSGELETSVPGAFAAGDCAGIGGVEMALAEAVIVAAAVLRRLGRAVSFDVAAAERRRKRVDTFRRAMARWAMPAARLACPDATVICRCEQVTAGAVRAAVDGGLTGLGPVKLATRAGMGLCQGRVCRTAVSQLIADGGDVPLGEIAPGSVRAPLRPIPIGVYAGSR